LAAGRSRTRSGSSTATWICCLVDKAQARGDGPRPVRVDPPPALAQEAARTHRHDSIGTEHLLLGLLGEPRGLAYELLVAKAGSEQAVRDAIEAAMPPTGDKAQRGHIAFRPEGKEVIDQARRASHDLGHDWVGTEHMLLALIRVEEGLAARILRTLGFTPDELHETVKAETAARVAARGE
jgi:ATP-dependent Clp protease ATP-binding subunit ClpA